MAAAESKQAEKANDELLMEVKGLTKHFPIHKGLLNRLVGHVHAVNGVDFTIRAGQKLGLVGESGCGKSTLGKTLVRLWSPSGGEIHFQGKDISNLSPPEMKPLRRGLQMIFQDPYNSLNPRMTIYEILKEPLKLHKIVPNNRAAYRKRVQELLDIVGMPEGAIDKYPHEFSGGQRQRIGIARAISTNPSLIVADEPVSALDVSVQAQIINLMDDLRDEHNVAFLFISHDLKVVHHFCDDIMVMYLGFVVESLPGDHVYAEAKHPYTRALLDAIPADDPFSKEKKARLEGDVPSPIQLPSGCPFRTRCPLAEERCAQERPLLREVGPNHHVACHLVEG